ncbi:sodium-coupled monocarboxylate transporter 1-like isoform X1 [Schistocerca nitens]|uniref:sodium-coupled monocarboxylate transporter 1-like isoform X1 n=2 Tax=Schistocerca nitens TaxID=7011 RepID=UPI002118CEFC|nr:sodium-coupled monocarboxylate transporter 1-like isoform X1 [Schistocerca nitens]
MTFVKSSTYQLFDLSMGVASQSTQFFSVADYLVFGGMLAVSTGIGLYHGCRKRKEASQDRTGEFLTGNGQMSTVPVALSMLASFLSSITLMGQPAEVYIFGPQLWLFGIAMLLSIPAVCYIFIPFYHRIKCTSAYEYFGTRFHKNVQLLASVLFTAQMVLYLALVLYAPAVALYQVTGLKTEIIVSVMYIVVIFYTTIGGIKAVVWTDCFQVFVLFISMIAVLTKGTIDIGGPEVVWMRNAKAGRTEFFNWNFDPTERYTVWSCLIGAGFLHNTVYGANQLQVQRYLTVKTVNKARQMMWINVVGWTAIVFLTVYAGMLIFARYHDCDPITSQMVKKPDQLFPLYIMDTLSDYPGFPGVFVAGIFSAGLSTVSTGLNSLAAIWFAEMDGSNFKKKLNQSRAALTVKLLALLFGLLSFALVFAVPYMGGLVPVAVSLSGFFSGALFALFLLGMYVPWVNAVGAAAGMIFGIGIPAWLATGSNIASEKGYVPNVLPVSTHNCSKNTTILPQYVRINDEIFYPYKISFLWYSLISIILTLLFGLGVSWLFNFECFQRQKLCNIKLRSLTQRTTEMEHQTLSATSEESNKLLIAEGNTDKDLYRQS